MSLSGNEDFQIRSSLKFSAVPRLVYPLRIRSNGIPSRLSIITRDTKTFISVAEFHFQILVLLLSKKKKNSSCNGLNCDPLPEVAMNDPRRAGEGNALLEFFEASLKAVFPARCFRSKRRTEEALAIFVVATPLFGASGIRSGCRVT